MPVDDGGPAHLVGAHRAGGRDAAARTRQFYPVLGSRAMSDDKPMPTSYEQARTELAEIVRALEAGTQSLEESLALWERGEALAAHCTSWLDGAQRQISEAGPAAAP